MACKERVNYDPDTRTKHTAQTACETTHISDLMKKVFIKNVFNLKDNNIKERKEGTMTMGNVSSNRQYQ